MQVPHGETLAETCVEWFYVLRMQAREWQGDAGDKSWDCEGVLYNL